MNQYGSRARRYWAAHLPERYAQIEDPTVFFTDLGEQMAQQVDELSLAIAGADRPGEGYLEKVGRLSQARLAAEEEVMREMLPASEQQQKQGDVNGTAVV
jgi:hypothetical protein